MSTAVGVLVSPVASNSAVGASAPLLTNANSVITATARRSAAPALINTNSVISSTARR